MFTYETADQKEVRRFRIAQFNGRPATIKCGATTVTGFVRSVMEQSDSISPRWTITIIPSPTKQAHRSVQSALHASLFADDRC